jgi:multidrug efflux pump subunit AcrA (membrane-fusion protein)
MKPARLVAILVVIGATAAVDIRVSAEDVVTMTATQKRIVAAVSAPARVQAAANAVLSAPAAGIVSGLRVLPGEEVRPGQSVARLADPTHLSVEPLKQIPVMASGWVALSDVADVRMMTGPMSSGI